MYYYKGKKIIEVDPILIAVVFFHYYLILMLWFFVLEKINYYK